MSFFFIDNQPSPVRERWRAIIKSVYDSYISATNNEDREAKGVFHNIYIDEYCGVAKLGTKIKKAILQLVCEMGEFRFFQKNISHIEWTVREQAEGDKHWALYEYKYILNPIDISGAFYNVMVEKSHSPKVKTAGQDIRFQLKHKVRQKDYSRRTFSNKASLDRWLKDQPSHLVIVNFKNGMVMNININ